MILVTGASGFLGREVSKRIKNKRCVIRGNGLKNESFSDSNLFIVSNIDGETDWKGAFSSIDAIIHIAGVAHTRNVSKADFGKVNVEGTLNLALQAAKSGVKRFVFVSSIGVNGRTTTVQPFSASSKVHPHNDYARSKYDAESGLQKISHSTGMEVVIVRPPLVYGVNAPGNFSSLAALIRRIPLLPFGAADNRRNFIAVQNLADLLIVCATHADAGGNIFLASEGEAISIKEFSDSIAEGMGKKVLQLPIPVWAMHLAGKLTGKSAMIEQLYGNLEVDSSNIKKILGWTPPLTMKQAMATLRDSGVKK
ncbi:NAD-dependent epimerase/dehydratase family protein [Vibrio sp. MA64]|uniref:NAD-dependent epimerase/dehydratase family protein n=1 Tax=Vibrio sp. MA64 TaxID=2896365 RepID=UPI001E54BB76|nr:NAD-dependent epimerase/dehydratase family protein [Vibrio sp. MA64]MCC9651531.1 NAD-dependent epimerase/dehydratase family protein [Vibrio sp. MA64]